MSTCCIKFVETELAQIYSHETLEKIYLQSISQNLRDNRSTLSKVELVKLIQAELGFYRNPPTSDQSSQTQEPPQKISLEFDNSDTTETITVTPDINFYLEKDIQIPNFCEKIYLPLTIYHQIYKDPSKKIKIYKVISNKFIENILVPL